MSEADKTVLIAGIGNELLGDEGLGVHVARALLAAPEALQPQVEVLEAGTALLDFLPELTRYARVILVDAIRAGREAGTVYRAEMVGDLAGQLETSSPVSLHEWGLLESLRAAKTLGMLPERLTLLGSEPECVLPGTELSPKLRRAADQILSLLLEEFGTHSLDASGQRAA